MGYFHLFSTSPADFVHYLDWDNSIYCEIGRTLCSLKGRDLFTNFDKKRLIVNRLNIEITRLAYLHSTNVFFLRAEADDVEYIKPE